MTSPEQGPAITTTPVEIFNGPDDRKGMLVFADQRLAAVFTQLDGGFHGPFVGMWFLEAGFGPCRTRPTPFVTIEMATAWVRRQTDGHV